jgi:hypothetical protein
MWAIATSLLGPLRLAVWPVWLLLKGFFTTNGFLAALLIGGGVLLYQYDQSRVKEGERREGARRDRDNGIAVETANRGRAGAGGKRVLDPYARAE